MNTNELESLRLGASKYEPAVEWRPVLSSTIPSCDGTPCGRWKQAVTLYRGWLYVHGGRCARQPLKDLWRWREEVGWQQVYLQDCPPPPLEGHSMVGYNSSLFIFGGTYGGYPDCPLWVVDLRTGVSRQWNGQKDVMHPVSRRHHSCVLFHGALYIMGGIVDVRGASNDFWAFDLASQSWHLVWSPGTHSSLGPSPRFGHSACEHDSHMWLFGGYNDLRLCPNELWRWSFRIGQWCRVRFNVGPSPMAYHACSSTSNHMLIYGGEGKDSVQQQLWAFSFSTLSWCNIRSLPLQPSGTFHHSLICLSPLDLALLCPMIPSQYFSEPALPRTSPTPQTNRAASCRQTPRVQVPPAHVHSHDADKPVSCAADSAFSESSSDHQELTLEDIEDCTDLFNQSNASLISSLSSEAPSEPEDGLPPPVPNPCHWAFTNQSLSVSSFGSVNTGEEDEYYQELESFFLDSQICDPSLTTVFCLGAHEIGIESRSLIIWRGCVRNL